LGEGSNEEATQRRGALRKGATVHAVNSKTFG